MRYRRALAASISRNHCMDISACCVRVFNNWVTFLVLFFPIFMFSQHFVFIPFQQVKHLVELGVDLQLGALALQSVDLPLQVEDPSKRNAKSSHQHHAKKLPPEQRSSGGRTGANTELHSHRFREAQGAEQKDSHQTF